MQYVCKIPNTFIRLSWVQLYIYRHVIPMLCIIAHSFCIINQLNVYTLTTLQVGLYRFQRTKTVLCESEW